jgi:hypothetical protein
MFEHRHQPLLSRTAFFRRLATSLLIGVGLIFMALTIGMLGYHHFERMLWIDSFANAAMILSGMGPLGPPLTTNAGKLFAGFYALFSGIFFIAVAGIVLAPAVHRFLHRFHLEQSGTEDEG